VKLSQQVTEMLVLDSTMMCIIAQEDFNDIPELVVQQTTMILMTTELYTTKHHKT
jgi:hypothetical protein